MTEKNVHRMANTTIKIYNQINFWKKSININNIVLCLPEEEKES